MSDHLHLKGKRIANLLPVPFVLLVMYAFYWGLYQKEHELNEEPPVTIIVVGWLVFLIGSFLCFFFLRNVISPPTILQTNDEGFEYIPNGVSTRFIRWAEIMELREVYIRIYSSSGADAFTPALAVILKDPESYLSQFNAPIRQLMRGAANQYGSSILLEPGVLGEDYPKMVQLLEKHTNTRVVAYNQYS